MDGSQCNRHAGRGGPAFVGISITGSPNAMEAVGRQPTVIPKGDRQRWSWSRRRRRREARDFYAMSLALSGGNTHAGLALRGHAEQWLPLESRAM